MALDVPPFPAASFEDEHDQPLLQHRPLYASASLGIDEVIARPCCELPTDERELTEHGLVLPWWGVFTTHAGRRQATTATASHGVLLSARTPYRYSYPGTIGDRCLVLSWSDEGIERAAPAAIRRARFDTRAAVTAPLLEPGTVLARERLRRQLARPGLDPLAVEEEAVGLLAAVSRGLRRGSTGRETTRGAARVRCHSRVERIKALVATAPTRRWTLDALAAAAALSPGHLAHVFKAQVGISVYEYVLRARLADALPRVLETGLDLTTIALDAGFSSHSHFTARFRARFGITPLELRRQGPRRCGIEPRRIAG